MKNYSKIAIPTDWIALANKVESRLHFRQIVKTHNPELWPSPFPEIIEIEGRKIFPSVSMQCPLWQPHRLFPRLTMRTTYAKREIQCQRITKDFGVDPLEIEELAFESEYPWRIITKTWMKDAQALSFFYFIPALIDPALESFWETLLAGNRKIEETIFDGGVLYEVTYPQNSFTRIQSEQFLAMLLCQGMFSLEKQWEVLGWTK